MCVCVREREGEKEREETGEKERRREGEKNAIAIAIAQVRLNYPVSCPCCMQLSGSRWSQIRGTAAPLGALPDMLHLQLYLT